MLDPEHLRAAYGRADRTRRWVRANFVTSLDGAATHDGSAGPLGDPEDQQVLHLLRQLADVVVVGAGTVRVEGYGGLGLDDAAMAWRRSQGLSDVPPLAIVSSVLDLPAHADVFTAPGPRPLVLTHAAAPAQQRTQLAEVAEIVVCGERTVEPARMLAELESRGMRQVLSEGGPRFFGTLVEADVVDELCLSLAPIIEGGEAMRITRATEVVSRRLRLAHVIRGEEILFLRYERRR